MGPTRNPAHSVEQAAHSYWGALPSFQYVAILG